MSEEKLQQILEDLVNGEMEVEDAFAFLECHINFSETYEGELGGC